MTKLVRTNSKNEDFIDLVKQLDLELAMRDGEEHSFYAQFNKIDQIKYVVILYEGKKPLGCGAIKAYAPGIMEVKRMYTIPTARGKKVALRILGELEKWATELSFKKCLLETGTKQPEAIALYSKSGYLAVPNYGQYENIQNSICFEKSLCRAPSNK